MGPQREHAALIAQARAVIAAHQGLLTHPGQIAAQARQGREIEALLQASGGPLSAATALRVLARVTDCMTRLAAAVQDAPGPAPVRGRLLRWVEEVSAARDLALTRSLHRGPARRPEKPKQRGWNAPGA